MVGLDDNVQSGNSIQESRLEFLARKLFSAGKTFGRAAFDAIPFTAIRNECYFHDGSFMLDLFKVGAAGLVLLSAPHVLRGEHLGNYKHNALLLAGSFLPGIYAQARKGRLRKYISRLNVKEDINPIEQCILLLDSAIQDKKSYSILLSSFFLSIGKRALGFYDEYDTEFKGLNFGPSFLQHFAGGYGVYSVLHNSLIETVKNRGQYSLEYEARARIYSMAGVLIIGVFGWELYEHFFRNFAFRLDTFADAAWTTGGAVYSSIMGYRRGISKDN